MLEHIFLYLDLRTLLFSQRVSRGFKDAIDASLKIHRSLFFQPLVKPIATDNKAAYKDNNSPSQPSGSTRDTETNIAPFPALANPLMNRFLNFHVEAYDTFAIGFNINNIVKLIRSPTASWRKMYGIQPRPGLISVSVYSETGGDIIYKYTTGDRGALMGLLFDLEMRLWSTANRFDMDISDTHLIRLRDTSTIAMGKYDVTLAYEEALERTAAEACGWDVLNCDGGSKLEALGPGDEPEWEEVDDGQGGKFRFRFC